MANAEQIEYWNGPGGEHWVAEHERYDQLVRAFGERLLEEVAPSAGERVLDVGCGNGALALGVARRVGPDGSVLGLDISRPMLEVASSRAKAAGLDNVSFEFGDAQVHSLPAASFDAIISRFGVMFFDAPSAAFTNLTRALRPGGRLGFVCWQDLLQNEWIMVPASAALAHVPFPSLDEPGQPGPFSLAEPDRVTGLLGGAGLVEVALREVVASMCMGSSVDDVMAFIEGTDMVETLLAEVTPEAAAAALGAMREALAGRAGPDGVVLSGNAWLVTARRPDGFVLEAP